MESKPVSMPVGPEAQPTPQVQEAFRLDSGVRSAPQSDTADLRLIIEQDSVSGQYVYKTVDRRTGDVVQQLPRDEILEMQKREAYIAGDVVQAKA
jgi:flagellar protein FlaG